MPFSTKKTQSKTASVTSTAFFFLLSHLDEHSKAEKVNNSLFHSQLNINFDCSDFTYMHPFVLDNIEAQLSHHISYTIINQRR
jgi:hypothetical protein